MNVATQSRSVLPDHHTPISPHSEQFRYDGCQGRSGALDGARLGCQVMPSGLAQSDISLTTTSKPHIRDKYILLCSFEARCIPSNRRSPHRIFGVATTPSSLVLENHHHIQHTMLKSSFFSLGLLYFPTIQALPTQECPILGPSFPSSFDITTTKAFRDAKSSFPKRVEALFSSGLVNRTGSAFTIDVFSTVTNSSIHSYYHAGSALKDTLVGSATDDGTIMRIGSVAKLYTIYAILVHAGMNVLNHPVTRYLPELAGNAGDDPIERIIWEDITVGALASQQGGTGGFGTPTHTFMLVEQS